MNTVTVRPFPFDSDMPALAQSVDPAWVGAVLKRYFLRADGHFGTVQDCRVVRIRYRPQQRCVLQYAITVRDRVTSTSRQELVTGILHGSPGRASRRAQRQGMHYVPELDMQMCLFPADRKLPQAEALVAAEDQSLQQVVLRSFGRGEWRIHSWDTEVVRYREGLSLVVRYTVTAIRDGAGARRRRVFYAKAYPDAETLNRTNAWLQRLADYSARAKEWRIQAPLSCLSHLGALLFAATPGQPLSDLLDRESDAHLVRALRETARTVAMFNLSDAPMVRRFSAADYVYSLRRPVAILARACPECAPELHRITRSADELEDVELRPTHRDMKPEHVLIGREQPAFIDLDSGAAADPVLDAGLMLARFTALAQVARDPLRVRTGAAAFTHEYCARVPTSWRDRLHTYVATSLLEVAAGLFHRQEARWRERIPALLGSAVNTLSTGRLPVSWSP